HEHDEREQFPQILNETEIEFLQLVVPVSVDEDYNKLNQAEDQDRPEYKPGDKGEPGRIKKTRHRKRWMGWRQAVGRIGRNGPRRRVRHTPRSFKSTLYLCVHQEGSTTTGQLLVGVAPRSARSALGL